jgi:hypothetical protein
MTAKDSNNFAKGVFGTTIEPEHTLSADYTSDAIEREEVNPVLMAEFVFDGNTDDTVTIKVLVSVSGNNFSTAKDNNGDEISVFVSAGATSETINIIELYYPFIKFSVEHGSATIGELSSITYRA